jgi:hypothetical protein
MAESDDKAQQPKTVGETFTTSLESRRQTVREADTTSAYAIRLGASNPPFDCEIFSPDYRGRLPEGDPVRERAGALREFGTRESLRTMEAAHHACLVALGVPGLH